MILCHVFILLCYAALTIVVLLTGIIYKTYSSDLKFARFNYNMTFLQYAVPYYYPNSSDLTNITQYSNVDTSTFTIFKINTYAVCLFLTGLLTFRSIVLLIENLRLYTYSSNNSLETACNVENFGLVWRKRTVDFYQNYVLLSTSVVALSIQWFILFIASITLVVLICLLANFKSLNNVALSCFIHALIWIYIIKWPLHRIYKVDVDIPIDPMEFKSLTSTKEPKAYYNKAFGMFTAYYAKLRPDSRVPVNPDEWTIEQKKAYAEFYDFQITVNNKPREDNYICFNVVQFMYISILFILTTVQVCIQLPKLDWNEQVAICITCVLLILQYLIIKYILYSESKQREKRFANALLTTPGRILSNDSNYPEFNRLISGSRNVHGSVWLVHEILLLVGVTCTVAFLLVN